MENRNIKTRFLEERDIQAVNDLHNRLYNDNRTESQFRWEFFNAPAGKAIYIVAEDIDNKKIVGTQCAIPIILKGFKGRTFLTAKSEDTLVDPDYRGMQIFEKMYDMLFQACRNNGINYIWGFTSAMKPFKKIGFDLPFSHGQSLLVNKVMPAYDYLSKLNPSNTKKDKFKIYALCLLSKARAMNPFSWAFEKTNAVKDISSTVSKDLNAMIDTILDEHEKYFTFDETHSYIDWRINQNPYHDQVFSVDFTIDGELRANIIFNHHTNGVWYLIQALFDENLTDPEKTTFLSGAVKSLLKSKSPALIRVWNFNSNKVNEQEIKILKKAGFFFLSRGVYFVWKDLELKKELDPKYFILSRMASQGVI